MKEARLLKDKAVASLLLSIDHFNRPWDIGRLEAVLILLDHSFEMLLKASILKKGGKIREPREKNTIGFDVCVRRALSTEGVKFLTPEQALVLQTINGLRDAAQHHLLTLSEGQLYLHAQSGVTLFRDILKDVFDENLADMLPERALALSTVAPVDPLTLFETEIAEVHALLAPGRRKRTEAEARLRGLAIVDSALQGERSQPSTSELRRLGSAIAAGQAWHTIFPGIAAVDFTAQGQGPQLSLRITKKEGMPVHLVPEDTPDATVVAVKRVDELGYYSLGHKQLAGKAGLTTNKTTAAIRLLNLKDDPDCHKQITIGRSKFDRYSQQAVKRIKELLQTKSEDKIWQEYRQLTKKVGATVNE